MSMIDHDLNDINASLVRMMSLVREEVELAKRALVNADVAAAAECIALDEKVDTIQEELEQKILTVIARRQPAATDLRFLGGMHWALIDLERAGDNTVHVARIAAELAQEAPLKKYIDTERSLEILDAMIEMTIKALAEGNLETAKKAHAMDSDIDQLNEQIQRELLTYMLEDPRTITKASKLLRMARHLERAGDHMENMNEHIVFWLTAERM